jgi:hypothetical protein
MATETGPIIQLKMNIGHFSRPLSFSDLRIFTCFFAFNLFQINGAWFDRRLTVIDIKNSIGKIPTKPEFTQIGQNNRFV